jgi:hypothetical protein
MNKARIFVIFPLIALSAMVTGCSSSKSPDSTGTPPAAQGAGSSGPMVQEGNCTLPTVFTANDGAQPSSVSSLSKMSGTYQLIAIDLFSQLNAKGAISSSASIKLGTDGMRDTKVQSACTSTGTPYTETLPVVMTFHLPSMRITEADIGSDEDKPSTNHPTYADFVSNTDGKIGLKNNFSSKGPPYTTGLTLNDWISQLPAAPSISVLSDGSIEIKVRWTHKDITSDGYLHFQQQK